MMFDGCPDNVRLALPGDEEGLLDFLVSAHAENGIFALNETKVLDFIRRAIMRDRALIAVIDGGDGLIAASLGLETETFWYSDEWTLCEKWLYVSPKHRRSGYAANLIDFGKALSDRWGLTYQMGVMTDTRMDAKLRLYRRKMTMLGGFFIHGLDRAEGPLGKAARHG